MIFDFKYKKITWEDLSITMTKSQKENNSLNLEDEELPKTIKTETRRVSREINSNKYDKHNYYDMVNNCIHLTVKRKSELTKLFSKYKDLISGNSVKFMDLQ